MSPSPVSRRLLLGGASLGGLALGTGALHEAVAAGSRQGSLPRGVDVVVVGGGISGLVAARKLARGGHATHQAILDVSVGERGAAPYLPKGARFPR
jgi:monoamine oxidase